MAKKEVKTSIIEAKYVRESTKSILLDCEGDLEWFPKSQVKFDRENNSLEAPNWILKDKFPNENF